MKLLVLSDSHKNISTMSRAVGLEQPDCIIHLGDHERDAVELSRLYPQLPMLQVCGNCDVGRCEEALVRQLEGVVFFMTHGHRQGVKYSLLRVELAAREAGANVLLFGHTHQPMCDWHNGLWIVNPGTCSGHGPVTYAVIDVEDGCVRPAIRKQPTAK